MDGSLTPWGQQCWECGNATGTISRVNPVSGQDELICPGCMDFLHEKSEFVENFDWCIMCGREFMPTDTKLFHADYPRSAFCEKCYQEDLKEKPEDHARWKYALRPVGSEFQLISLEVTK